MSLWRRLKYLLPSYRRTQERELREELESLRAIAGPRELGNLTLAAENARAVWGWSWLESIGQDVRYSLRTHARHFWVTVVAVFSIAVGVGANTLVFSLVNALLFRPLPYPNSERLVVVDFSTQDGSQHASGLTRDNCMAVREQASALEEFGCYAGVLSASLAGEDFSLSVPERVRGYYFTADMARTLGVNPLAGRLFTESDEQPDADPVLLINYGLWQRRFGGRPDVIGKRVWLDGEPATVVGVMPDEFEFLNPNVQYWVLWRNRDYGAQDRVRAFEAVGRLRPGIAIQSAQAEMDAIAQRLAEESPDDTGLRIQLERLDVFVPDQYSTSAMTLQGVVLFVLLIACANVAGLLLAQGMSQQRELAVRVALGSNRWRIVRQLLTHSIVLSCIGSVLGLALGWWGLQFVRNLLPAGTPRMVLQTSLDSNVLLFTFLISLACGLLAGIAPAIQVSRAHPQDVLRESGRSATGGIARQKLRSAFVTMQIALAFVLLVGAGLMIKGLVVLTSEDIGFELDNLLAAQLDLPAGRFRVPVTSPNPSASLEVRIDPRVRLVSEQIRQNLEAIPNVASASAIAIRAPFGGTINMPVRPLDIDERQAGEPQRAQFLPVMPSYFRTLGVPVIQGREFEVRDSAGSVQVAMINQTMAARFWPDESALGKHIQVQSPTLPDEPSRQIVGVVSEIKQYPGQEARPQLYVPYSQISLVHDEALTNDLRNLTFIIRTSASAPQMADAIKAAVGRADPSQAVSYVQTMKQTAFGTLQSRRVFVGLIVAFGAIALVLAVIGVYGVIAQIVNQRTNEIGIRIALGADAGTVRRLVLRQGGRFIALGLLIGTIGAFALTRVIRSSIFGISPTDPLTFAVTLALMAGIALIACYAPARRASRIDPIRALRHE